MLIKKQSGPNSLLIFALCVLGTWFGFPNPIFHVPAAALLLPWGLATLAMGRESARNAFSCGFAVGTVSYGAALYWVAYPVRFYGSLSWFLSLPCPLLLGMYVGLFTGLFSLAVYYGEKRLSTVSLGIFAGLVWAGCEIIRGFLFTGFPWIVLTQTVASHPFAIQGVSIIGAYALAGVLAMIAVLFAIREYVLLPRVVALVIIAVITGFGFWNLNNPIPEEGQVNVSLIQGNIDQSLKWDASFQNETVDRYIGLTDKEINEHRPFVAIWPETSMPFYFQDENNPLSKRVREYSALKKTNLILGSPGYEHGPVPKSYKLYNRVFQLDAGSGGAVTFFDKRHLVPFGEYVPLGEYLPFVSKLVEGAGDFFPGRDSQSLLRLGKMVIGTSVCYEVIFPEIPQKDVENGANLLMSVSNDAWFGRTSAPEQHLDAVVLRAVEQGRWFARSTNTGYSAFIDPKGRIVARSSLFTTETVNYPTVGLIKVKTFYNRFYYYIHYGIYVLIALFVFRANSKPRKYFSMLKTI